jgi:hypothetical protein
MAKAVLEALSGLMDEEAEALFMPGRGEACVCHHHGE